MEKYILSNGIKLLYEYRQGNITSFCIGFNSGAVEENDFNMGIAHVVEHMIFKGTKKRSEMQINNSCDEIFGFHNAMTNFPYAIYYGTASSSDFEKGFELYSDLEMNPIFPTEGFNEEKMIILEELKDWKEDVNQFCEDTMLYNAFKERRIRNRIIGEEESIKRITLDEITRFYNKYYCPQNCVISVVSSLSYVHVVKTVRDIMDNWEKKFLGIEDINSEKNIPGIFYNKLTGIEGAKIQYCYTIDKLTEEELKALNIINLAFGDGVSSILYDHIRTQNGLAYEVYSTLKEERAIKLFTINMSTSKNQIERCIELVNHRIESLTDVKKLMLDYNFSNILNRYKLRQELSMEKSIELCKKLATYELMYGDCNRLDRTLYKEVELNYDLFYKVINMVFKEPTIQVLE